MHSFTRGLITEWRRLKLPTSGKTIVVAVSGGADSVSLMLGMHELISSQKLDIRIVAAHFDHHLRGDESRADAEYVRTLTNERKIEFALGGGNIHPKGNVEQNARHARYSFLASCARNLGAFAVITGHTVNDQAETFLMNLIRGSGVAGLAAMNPIRPLDDNVGTSGKIVSSRPDPILLVRPLLTWAKRRDTEGYCQHNGVEYRYDTMNEDTAFKRVRIRKVLLPLLEDMNPNIVETLANTAQLMQHAFESGRTGEMADECELELKAIRQLSEPGLFQTVRSWLIEKRGSARQLQMDHVEAVIRLAMSDKSGRRVELPGGGCVVRTGGRLVFEKNRVEN